MFLLGDSGRNQRGESRQRLESPRVSQRRVALNSMPPRRGSPVRRSSVPRTRREKCCRSARADGHRGPSGSCPGARGKFRTASSEHVTFELIRRLGQGRRARWAAVTPASHPAEARARRSTWPSWADGATAQFSTSGSGVSWMKMKVGGQSKSRLRRVTPAACRRWRWLRR